MPLIVAVILPDRGGEEKNHSVAPPLLGYPTDAPPEDESGTALEMAKGQGCKVESQGVESLGGPWW